MTVSFPFYYDGGDDYYYSPRDYELVRRQEELRRRRAAEVERRRKQEAYQRRLAYERELRRRVEEEQELRRQLEQEERQRQLNNRRGGRSGRKVGYQVVRGRDGRLYRIPAVMDDEEDEVTIDTRRQAGKKEKSSRWKRLASSFRGSKSKHVQGETGLETLDESSDSETESAVDTRTRSSVSHNEARTTIKSNVDRMKTNRRQRVTVIVEDASDSESEDDDWKSPWRNRRPSPGQWMEPVESFAGI